MAAPVIKFKRGANSSLPALKAGEPAFVTDEFDFLCWSGWDFRQ